MSISKNQSDLFSTSSKIFFIISFIISGVAIVLSTTGSHFPGHHFFLRICLFSLICIDIVKSSKYSSKKLFQIIFSIYFSF